MDTLALSPPAAVPTSGLASESETITRYKCWNRSVASRVSSSFRVSNSVIQSRIVDAIRRAAAFFDSLLTWTGFSAISISPFLMTLIIALPATVFFVGFVWIMIHIRQFARWQARVFLLDLRKCLLSKFRSNIGVHAQQKIRDLDPVVQTLTGRAAFANDDQSSIDRSYSPRRAARLQRAL